MSLLISLVFSLFTLQVLSTSIGDTLLRTFTKYERLPFENATNAGWHTTGSCDPQLGVAYNFMGYEPSVDYPITLYFTKAGQIAGIAVDIFGSVPPALLWQGFYQQQSSDQYRLSVTFRESSLLCSSLKGNETLGDRLIVNAKGIAYSLPITEKDAVNGNWHKGSCFYSMGYHYFYDLKTAPHMSWNASTLLPVVLMYNEGVVNSFFFASWSVQQGLFNAHWWEPIPLPNLLMCKNTCDSDCTFAGTSLWSTLHIYLRDYTKVTCPGNCRRACCP